MSRKSSRRSRRADGRFCAYYNRKCFYGRTPAEAEQKRDEYKKQYLEDRNPDTVIFRRYADRWLEITKVDCSTRTRKQYRTLIDRLCDEVGDKRIKDIRSSDIQVVISRMSGMSQSYIHKAMMLYREVFSAVVRDKIIYNNISDGITPPRGTVDTHRAIEDYERELIHSVPHRCRYAALIMLYEGLRRGEVLALQAKHINIEEKKITVHQSVVYDGNKPRIHPCKNRTSYRIVPLFDILLPLLSSWKQYVSPDAYVFPSASGGICTETAFQRAWESYMIALSEALNKDTRRWYGYRHNDSRDPASWIQVDIRCHDLRHSFVSAARDAGVDIHCLQLWCGHSSDRMIMQVYDHVRPERERQEAELLNRYREDKIGQKISQLEPDSSPSQETQGEAGADPLTTNQKVVGSNPAGLTKKTLDP